MVVVILALWAVVFLALSAVFSASQKLTLATTCQTSGTALMVAAFIVHGWIWEGAALSVVLIASIGLQLYWRRVKRRLRKQKKVAKISPLAQYYAAERARRPSSGRGIGPRRWPM
jgi:uncharacterized membrane protein YjgN (DUF898 family)